MFTTSQPAPDIDVLTTKIDIPALGTVPVNSYVLHGASPLLVDTGPVVLQEEFMKALRSVIDPGDLEWIWLTHTDFDHIGALPVLLAENPKLRVITTFLGIGIMGLFDPLPMDRVHLLNPGQQITVGDRTLTAFKPPAFDNPSTTGFHDESTGILFSSDCFGGVFAQVPDSAADFTGSQLRDGQVLWATVDSPWLHKADSGVLGKELDEIRAMAPTMVLSSHLPAAPGDMLDELLDSLAAAPAAARFVGPDQPMLEQMLAQMGGPPQ